MDEIKLKWWQYALILLFSFIVALGMTIYIGSDISSLDIFAPANKRGDFKITDIYNAVEINNNDNRPYSDYVVVVGIDKLDRRQTLEVINKVAQLHPAAIGLDFPFKESPILRDSVLLAILGDDRIVSPIRLDTSNRPIPMSFYEKEYPDVPIGYVNIMAEHPWNVVRDFCPYKIYNKDTIPSMVLALARLSNPEAARRLMDRRRDTEIINFVSHRIETISANLLDSADIARRIQGKAVLIGDTAYTSDIRLTPLHELMAGVKIHAYALQTILGETYIVEKSDAYTWTWAIIISILFLVILQCARNHLNYTGNFIIRLFQFFLLVGFVACGCKQFSDSRVYADFTNVIALAGFSALFFDISYACIAIIDFIIHIPQYVMNIVSNIKNKLK